MITEKVEKALIEQIIKEEYSARLYMAMASWCEKNGYQGASAFLYKHSDEERLHQLKFIHFLNDRGGYSILQDVPKPPFHFSSLKTLFQEILKHEQYITDSINKIYETCNQEKDYTTASFLQWFITEQIEEETLISHILDKMELAGEDKTGHFLIDKELGSMGQAAPGN